MSINTVYVMTQGVITSTAYGRPQAGFSQIFPAEYRQKQIFLEQKDALSLKFFLQSQRTFICRILIFYLIPIHEDMTILYTPLV